MDDDRQNGAVLTRPPGTSDTCGTIVNHGTAAGTSGSDRAASPQPPPPPPHHAFRFNLAPRAAAPATAAVGAPVRGAAAPPFGVHLNYNNNNNNNPVIKGQHQPKGPGNSDHRNRRPRRGKRKSKKVMPYMKNGMMFRYKALAPNNTNQFLMEDHNDGPDIDKKLSARYNNENGRTRNSSNTSLESDGEPIYSSSDDDGTSIQKEFIDTYRLIQEEQLATLTKNELTQRVIELEEKIQLIESKRHRKTCMSNLNDVSKGDEDDSIDPEEYRLMQRQIRELTAQNKLLQTEIETLKQVKTRKSNSESSVDSESSSESSDSSSSSSEGQEIEMKFLLRSSDELDEQNSTKGD